MCSFINVDSLKEIVVKHSLFNHFAKHKNYLFSSILLDLSQNVYGITFGMLCLKASTVIS